MSARDHLDALRREINGLGDYLDEADRCPFGDLGKLLDRAASSVSRARDILTHIDKELPK